MIWRMSHASLVCAVMILVGGCRKPAAAPSGPATPPSVPVSVAKAVRSDVPILLQTIGSVESKSTVILRAQVAGRITEVEAAEGSDVTAGQVLIKLDPKPFAADVAQAEANLARSKAMAEDAHRMEKRVIEATKSLALTDREVEEARAKSAAADAEQQAFEAAVDLAKLKLAYTTIRAPFSGRLGIIYAKPGSIVKENDTDIAEITQMDPIDVSFAVPEENIARIREAMAKGPLEVEAAPSGDTRPAAKGILTFVDNKVDATTSTIRLKATFKNEDRRLWPGQFSNVSLVLGQETDAVLVPESAVQATQAGSAVYVVKGDHKVDLRPVKVRRNIDGNAVIESGIAAEDIVVIEGQLRLGPGALVDIKPAPGVVPAETKH